MEVCPVGLYFGAAFCLSAKCTDMYLCSDAKFKKCSEVFETLRKEKPELVAQQEKIEMEGKK